jgi:hypothetical protein
VLRHCTLQKWNMLQGGRLQLQVFLGLLRQPDVQRELLRPLRIAIPYPNPVAKPPPITIPFT